MEGNESENNCKEGEVMWLGREEGSVCEVFVERGTIGILGMCAG